MSSFTLFLSEDNCLYFMGWRQFTTSHTSCTSPPHRPSLCQQISDSNSQFDAIKIGETNASLVETVARVGLDCPVIQVKDPQVIVSNISQLDQMMGKTSADGQRRQQIVAPQCIAALYSSPIQLQDGESIAFVGLSACQTDAEDRIFLILDTTIPSSANVTNKFPERRLPSEVTGIENPPSLPHESCNGDFSPHVPFIDSDEEDATEDTPDWLKEDLNEAQLQFAISDNSRSQTPNANGQHGSSEVANVISSTTRKWSSLPAVIDARKSREVEQLEDMVRVLHAGIQQADQVVLEYEQELQQLQSHIRALQATLRKRKMCSIL